MKKFLSITILIFFSAVYILSSSDILMKKIAPYRYGLQSIFGSDKYSYGDLYGLSYLPEYKLVPEKKEIPHCNYKRPGNINLYMICDSYIWGFVKTDSIFCNLNKFEYVRWTYNEQISEQMDTTCKNILIIEVSERYLRKFLPDSAEMYSSVFVFKNNSYSTKKPETKSLLAKILKYKYSEKINQNLEFNLFGYRFLTPLKEFTAEFNYKSFGRTNKDVSVSSDKKYLFYGHTTDSSKNTSSFNPVSEMEISDLISCINNEYNHFKALGFDEVYLSIIPNPVSIIEPGFGKYNNLVKRIQNNKDLLPPVIDVFDVFNKTPYEIYYRSDSHWNYDGFQLWVDQVNKILKAYTIR